MEELTLKSKKLEAELGMTSKKLEVAVLMARDDAEKIKSSEEIVRSLTLQVHYILIVFEICFSSSEISIFFFFFQLMNATKKEVDKTRRRRNSF